jgi:hypothetical protein
MLLALRGIQRLKAKWEIFATAIGEAGQIRSANKKILWIFFIRCISPIGEVRIPGPIVLEQRMQNKRIGEVRTTSCSTLPIVI